MIDLECTRNNLVVYVAGVSFQLRMLQGCLISKAHQTRWESYTFHHEAMHHPNS